MILELLQPDASLLDALTVLSRAAYHVLGLGAAGLFLFSLLEDTPRLRRWIAAAALLGLLASVAALPLRVLVLTAGESALDPEILAAVLGSRIGDAFWVRAGGLALLAGAAAAQGRTSAALGGAGVLLVAASYAAMGHSTLYRPRQELAGLVVLHLLAVAFWTGSLLPLSWGAHRGDGALVARWSRLGALAVGVVVATGGTLTFLLVRRAELLLAGWYGWALLAKLALFGLMLLLAARHRFRLTPALQRGEPGAGRALGRGILLEAAVAALVFYAAAELVSVHPLDAGHRIRG